MLPLFNLMGSGAGTEFPFVQTRGSSEEAGATTSHGVDLPAGVQNGDLIILSFSTPANETITWPGGWTRFANQVATPDLEIAYKVASGEGASITVTTAGTVLSEHTAYRIQGYSGIPEAGTLATGDSEFPNPPSLTPSWGNKKTLWIAIAAQAGTGTAFDSAPSNYTNLTEIGTGGHIIGSAERQREIATEDPGTFDLNNTGGPWATNTIAVQGI